MQNSRVYTLQFISIAFTQLVVLQRMKELSPVAKTDRCMLQ